MRVLVDSDTVIDSPVFIGSDGETPSDCSTLPTCTVTDHNGVALAAVVAADVGDGRYRAALLAASHTAILGPLVLLWAGTAGGRLQTYSQTVDVVGAHYATIVELRAMPGMSSPDQYPTARLALARDEYADIVESYRGVSFVPRLAVETFRGVGQTSHLLSMLPVRTIRSVTVDAVAIDPVDYAVGSYGLLWSDTVAFTYTQGSGENVTVAYEHGEDGPPEVLRHGCREYVRAVCKRETSGVDRDIIRQSVEGMSMQYSTPDFARGRPTGYLEVDRLINSVADGRMPVIA